MQRRNRTRAAGIAAIQIAAGMVIALATAGCEDYMKRRDPVSLGVGDAIATNKATQTINLWPRAAYQDRWVSDGEQARLAMKRYKTDTVKDPRALDISSPPADAEQSAPPPPGTSTGK